RKAGAAPKRAARAPRAPEDVDASGKSLVIVESPTKSKTLNKFLGRSFAVMASNGHIMDLPKSKLGVDLENNFEPQYEPIATKAATLAKLRAAARTASRVYLAPDPDREGEAIAWHLAEALSGSKVPIQRLTFNEITERAVKLALENPRDLDMNLVNAQQARRVLDRLVGYKVSPFLWKTLYFGLSAGRVQSVALRLICEREDAIESFVTEEYWTIEVDYATAAGESFPARLVKVSGADLEKGEVRGADAAQRARTYADELATLPGRIASVETTPKQVHPRAPFITSTLQQTAFNRLGFTSQRTMKVAQQLYEGVALGAEGSVGLITYMRTDSPRLAGEAIAEIRGWLTRSLGPEYVPEQPRQFKGKKSAQDAHEAIRPSSVARTPEAVKRYLSEEQFKLYDLIWKRATASQASSAEYLATTIEVEAGKYGLRASGRVLQFAGFQKLYGLEEEDEEKESRLPVLAIGTALAVAKQPIEQPTDGEALETVCPIQHFTQPPPRYTEGSLVKSLEEENIGRPSTYATIVSTITGRKYVDRDRGKLVPTELGRTVNKLLVNTFPDVFDVGFTATMEDELDEIEEGKREWQGVVGEMWKPLSRDLAVAEKSVDQHRESVQEETEIACPNCGRKLIRKFGRRGPFLACPGYPECKYTRPVDDAELPTPIEGTCPKCGSGLVARNGPYGRFISCEKRPTCDYARKITLGIACPDCGEGEILEKRTRRGKVFFSCTRYPECKFAAWDRPRPVPCPNCGAAFMVEKETKRKGLMLRCLQCKMEFPPEPASA
ncbi:MAG: type I DNA topoisomerase, partial [Candidatus Eisenbacteria bacterium]|nr:type I DNA topoisomerase [Candidatus Eisenbacteria bacterium]